MTEWLHFHFSFSGIGEGNGNPLQCSCLENPRDGGAWWAAFYGAAQSQTRLKRLSSSSSSRSIFSFLRTSILFSIMTVLIYIPTNNVGEIPFLHTLSAFIICRWPLFLMVILTGMRWYLIMALICIPLIQAMLRYFLVLMGHMYVFFGEKLI